MGILSLFPSIIHTSKIVDFLPIKKELIHYIHKEKEKDPYGTSISNIGGWQSKDHYAKFKNPLLDSIVILTNGIIKDMTVFKSNIRLEFLNMWININKKGNSNTKHIHPMCDLSGVFWINQPKNSGDIFFESPRLYNYYSHINCLNEELKKKLLTSSSIQYKPEEGKVILFPAALTHGVMPNKSEEERISVAFNMKISNLN